MAVEITWYKDNLRNQVVALFEKEYGVKVTEFNSLFEQFYFHPYQKNKCLLIVAMDGDTVAGFQSFFHWPYTFENKTLNSFQSGNSLIHPSYRGKGIFNKMLAFIDQENKTLDIDFLIGFPVEASLKNFLKDKWDNILDLRWYVRFCNPLGFGKLPSRHFIPGCISVSNKTELADTLSLTSDPDFTSWRSNYQKKETYFSFRYKNNDHEIIFHIKRNKRKKLINELIIGNILFNSSSAIPLLTEALEKLIAKATYYFSCHFISIAFNELSKVGLMSHLVATNFKRTEKGIYFITKPFRKREVVIDPKNWVLFRSDVDTW